IGGKGPGGLGKQDHGPQHQIGGAGAGAGRGVVGDAVVGADVQGAQDRRQGGSPRGPWFVAFTTGSVRLQADDLRSTTMGLLERVGTLVRANLNDLIDKAENPSKMIKQVILDMENQLLQVKTQVAISIADQHMLEKKEKEHEEKAVDWLRKAELAVDRGQDDLARAALERQKGSERTADSIRRQV